ncbi:DUF4349 domain-containing protein [Streptomyces sp. MAR25Y5]|uniref:DUF4349 domain-containing protein n=1 Tax=Streptomyces sp. MAR25Y5 TaxID=2962028 RepID=UPI0020B82D37|nr:DUF4349 domain-containing protein [Streptomyces sp. MAR25Y5]MCP3767212.1 DUF4349 domain-containing protein [Streptomyces sp. MAR25Y5]
MRTRRSVRPAHAMTGLLLAAALALAGCGAGSGSDSGASSASDDKAALSQADARGNAQEGAKEGAARDGAAGGSADGSPATAPPADRSNATNHVIRTASLTVRVKDAPAALAEARTATENAGGYVGDETTRQDAEGNERTRVVLRVPAEKYDAVLADLEGSGELVERRAKAEDVTDQVVDVESRIKTQRASVARIRELMDRAVRLSDVVTLEGELSTRQADLESLLARQASLKDRTGLATVTLTLSETPVERSTEDDDPGFLDALAGGWDAFVTMLRWLAVAIGAALPFAALAALLALLWLKAVRPGLSRRTRPAPSSPSVPAFPSVPAARPASAPTTARTPDEAPKQAPGPETK